jgi:O-antigen/teichoic acid export membrane protein
MLAITLIFFTMTIAETLGKKMYRQYALLFISQRVVQIVLAIILYYQLGILGVLIGYIIGNLIFSYRYFRNALPNFTLKFNEIKQKRKFAMHSYGAGIIRTFSNFLDKLIIAPLFGYYLLGLYQLGFQFFLFLSIIPLSLYAYLLPEESSGKDKKTIKLIGVALSIVAAIAAIIGLPYIIERFFSNFTESIPIVQIMSLAIIPATIIAILNATLLGRGNSKPVFIAGIAYIIALVIGLVTLGQTIGAIGLAITLLVAQTVQASYLSLKRKPKQTPNNPIDQTNQTTQ